METIHDMNDLALEGRRTGAAIYAIERTDTSRRYVASTLNFSKRAHDAKAALTKRAHHNPALDADLKALGPDLFRVVILELVDDVKTLPVLRRLHAEHARQSTGGCYNAEPPPARKRLAVDRQASEAVAERRRRDAEKSLNDALDRMGSHNRRMALDQIMSKWQQTADRGQR